LKKKYRSGAPAPLAAEYYIRKFQGGTTLEDEGISAQLKKFACSDEDLIPYVVQGNVTTVKEEYMVVLVLFRVLFRVTDPVAVAGLYLQQHPFRTAVLQTLCVSQGNIRNGLGKLFMAHIFRFVQREGIEQVQIGTVTTEGAKFYACVGFTPPPPENADVDEFEFVIGKEAMESHSKKFPLLLPIEDVSV
tara:strand:- start:434 stop:1003 length:570 start_codon:yes stop_codon:yes gene_type:complete